jgi:hypothetical protein
VEINNPEGICSQWEGSGVIHILGNHKLTYCTKARWEVSWINTACEIISDEFDCSYPSSSSLDDIGKAVQASVMKVH